MGIGVIVEIIRDGEAPGIDGIARERPVATELIRITLDVLPLRAEAKIVLDEQPCDVRLGSRTGYAGDLSIGWIGDTVDTAESLSAGDLRIEHKYGVLFEPHAEKQSACERDIVLGIIRQAERPSVRRMKCPVLVADRGGLIEQIPTLRFDGCIRGLALLLRRSLRRLRLLLRGRGQTDRHQQDSVTGDVKRARGRAGTSIRTPDCRHA